MSFPTGTVDAQALPKIKAQSTMAIDSVNGQILYDYDEENPVNVGEVSKVLTLYTVMDAIKQGQIKAEDIVPISDQAYELSQDYDLANVPLRQDFQYTVEELMEVVAVNGANGATLALAEFVGGGQESKFIKKMEAHLDTWGISDYKLYNSTGLASELVPKNAGTYDEGPSNQLNAKALAYATYHLLKLNPKMTEYASQTKMTFKKDTDDPYETSSYNKILKGQNKEYKGATGFLIGSSKEDGNSAIFTAKRGNLSAIVVILGADEDREDGHYSDGHKVLDYVFATYVVEHVVKKGERVSQISAINILEGVQTTAKLAYQEDLMLVTPIIDTAPVLTYEFIPKKDYFEKERLKAPIKKDTTIGQIKIDMKDSTAKFIPGAKGNHVKVGMFETVEKANIFQKTWQGVTQTISNSLESARQFFTNIFN